MTWSSSTTRHVGWLRSVLILWPDDLNASNPFLPDPLASPLDGSPPRFRVICSFSVGAATRSVPNVKRDDAAHRGVAPTCGRGASFCQVCFSYWQFQRLPAR